MQLKSSCSDENEGESIVKLRCSDHPLEKEKGRHKNIPRERVEYAKYDP